LGMLLNNHRFNVRSYFCFLLLLIYIEMEFAL
jgi:hypothetical protein